MRKDGFTLIEIVVAMALAALLMTGVLKFVNAAAHYMSTANTMTQIKRIETALDTTYRENISYIEQNCYGWTDAACNTLTLLPAPHPTDNTKLLLNTFSSNAIGAWQVAGCTMTGTAPSFTMSCNDGYGLPFTYAITNAHAANGAYANGYNRTPYSLTITSTAPTALTDTWSSGYLDGEYAAYSQRKILTVTGALKTYHLSRLTNETVVNTCNSVTGGLESFDDVIVPWYFQVTGTSPTTSCSGVESGSCGCSGFTTALWPASGSGWNQINTATKFITVYGNLGLSSVYRVDGFGNAIELWLTVNSAGTLQAEPPRPRPSYSGVWAIGPPYHGQVGARSAGAWLYSQPIVYVQ